MSKAKTKPHAADDETIILQTPNGPRETTLLPDYFFADPPKLDPLDPLSLAVHAGYNALHGLALLRSAIKRTKGVYTIVNQQTFGVAVQFGPELIRFLLEVLKDIREERDLWTTVLKRLDKALETPDPAGKRKKR